MTMNKPTVNSSIWYRSAWFVLCFFVFIGLYTIGDYGMAWDETFRFQGGDAKLGYYQELLRGEQPDTHQDVYPGLFDVPLALAHQQFPELGTRSEKGHLWSFCFGVLGIVSVWRMAALAGGERAGFWALLLFATLPRYYGHIFMNPKDVPLAGTYACALWSLLRVFQQWPKPSWSSVSLLGIVAGLSMSTRIAGFLVLCYFGLFVGLLLLRGYWLQWQVHNSMRCINIGRDLCYWLKRGALAGVIAFTILFIFWPRLHQNPFEQLDDAANTVQNYEWSQNILMAGDFYPASELPIYYTLYWLGVTLSDGALLLFVVGLVLAAVECIRRIRGRALDHGLDPRLCALLLFAVVFPLIYLIGTAPVLYDSMRHFLFVLPPLICVSALALEWMLRALHRCESQFGAQAITAMVATSVLLTLVDLVRLHPYQYVYFNRVSGGLPAAYMNRDTDYWGLSYREAAEWLNANIPTEAEGGLAEYRVLQKNAPWMLEEFLDDRFEIVFDASQANFYVAITRFNLHEELPGLALLHVVERQGVPLCFIFAPQMKQSLNDD